MSNSIEDFKLNQYRNFRLILLPNSADAFSFFMRYFEKSIIFRVSHRLLYCVFIDIDFVKIENAGNIHISAKVSQSRT